MIRKHFHDIKIVGVLTALLALASCAGDEFDSTKNADGPKFGLTVVTNDQVSTRTPGDDNLNENRFVSIDYFFFAQNHDEDVLLLHKTEGVRNDANNTTLDNSTHTYNGPLSASDLIALFGDTDVEDGTTCYVYVLTNLLPSTRAAIESEKTTLGDNFSLGILKRISFQDTNISANGKQECFVMFGGGEVSLTTDADTNVRTISGNPIRVTRDAAKVVLTVRSLQEEVEVKDADDNVVARWKSVPDQMHVMFYNGKNKSNVHSQINAGLHYVPEENDDCYFDLTFYTYLSDWTEVSGADPDSYMILVVPWQQVDVETGENINAPIATYYQIQTSTTDTYYENYYYHIFIDVGILGSFELPEPKVIKGTYMIVPWGEKNIDATMREPVYLIVEENEFIMNNVSSASVPYITSHEITQAYVTQLRYINTSTFETVTRTNTTDTDGTVNLRTYVGNETFTVDTENGLLTLTHTISSSQYTRYEVTVRIRNSKGLEEEVVFIIYPAIYVDIEPGGDVFVNGRFVHVQNAKGNRTGNNYPWYNRGGYNWYTNTTHNTNDFYETTGYGSLRFNLGDGGVNSEALTKITVTSFSENDNSYNIRVNNANTSTAYTFKLTDPRVESAIKSNLEDYIVTANSSRGNLRYAAWQNVAGSIMTGSPSNDAIAPEFLICSGWGRTRGENAQDFQKFEKRCATYQEKGYPAGRWRLPTEAELTFIYRLQALNVIPVLFQAEGSAYWASSGRAIESYNAQTLTAHFLTNPSVQGANTAGVRCVYDIWYWGEEKMDANEYHPVPKKQ